MYLALQDAILLNSRYNCFMAKLAAMVSGSGSNLQAIIDAIDDGRLQAEIVLVVSNRKAAYGLVRAETAGIPTLYFPLKPYLDNGRSREEYDVDLAEAIRPYAPDVIVLAGWMHILSPAFIDAFPNKIINLHPALPGQFAGTHAIERAFQAFQNGEIEHSGCMIHYVIPEVDAGAVIDQEQASIYAGDTLEDFAGRMHTAEHELIVRAIRKII
jgi:formyltetrahydrofolate-dependent phosphoribosylglycinamide formyltransferase